MLCKTERLNMGHLKWQPRFRNRNAVINRSDKGIRVVKTKFG